MKKIYVLIAVAIIGILGWCAIVNATENIIDLGTIEYSNIYEKTLVVNINSSEFVDLRYTSSDIDKSSLYIFNCWFSPLDNLTTYVFATSQIEVDWWFINDTKGFIYQDNNTDQLYCVNVDYSAIDVPPDPLIEWMDEYDILVDSFAELEILLNTTLNELNATRNKLREKWDTLNMSQEKFDNNSIAMEKMKKELYDLDIKYNETEALWTSAITNASTYELYWKELGDEYNALEKDHNNLRARYPIYIFAAIIITSIILTVYFKRKKIFQKEEKTDLEIERDTGYNQKASRIDKFTTMVLKKVRPKRGEDIQPPSEIKEESKPNMEDIHKKIDGIKLTHDTFQESTVKDIQGIQKRVDVIETKLKIKVK